MLLLRAGGVVLETRKGISDEIVELVAVLYPFVKLGGVKD